METFFIAMTHGGGGGGLGGGRRESVVLTSVGWRPGILLNSNYTKHRTGSTNKGLFTLSVNRSTVEKSRI